MALGFVMNPTNNSVIFSTFLGAKESVQMGWWWCNSQRVDLFEWQQRKILQIFRSVNGALDGHCTVHDAGCRSRVAVSPCRSISWCIICAVCRFLPFSTRHEL